MCLAQLLEILLLPSPARGSKWVQRIIYIDLSQPLVRYSYNFRHVFRFEYASFHSSEQVRQTASVCFPLSGSFLVQLGTSCPKKYGCPLQGRCWTEAAKQQLPTKRLLLPMSIRLSDCGVQHRLVGCYPGSAPATAKGYVGCISNVKQQRE